MPGRTQSSTIGGYKYAHNGQEKDNEIFDGALSAEFWEYDSRIGRRWEEDPIVKPWESPYATFANNPIAYSDVKGLDAKGDPKKNRIKGNHTTRKHRTGGKGGDTKGKNKGKDKGNPEKKQPDKKPPVKQKDKKQDPSPSKNTSSTNAGKKNGMAILVSYPDKKANTPIWIKKAKEWGLPIPDETPVGHAGIVIINTETGETNYFDFGRYKDREKELGKLGDDKGIVRSAKTVPALQVPNWNTTKSNAENVTAILTNIHGKSIFAKYGRTVGALATDLDYDAMIKQARDLEDDGYKDFGGYHTGACSEATYCAKFARCVGGAGGIDFSMEDFMGIQNVRTVSKDYKTGIIVIADKPKK